MKKNNLVHPNLKAQLEIQWSPEITKQNIDRKNWILGYLLSRSKKFNIRIQKARKTFDIDLIGYPQKASVKKLVKLLFNAVENKKRRDFEKEMKEINSKFQLTENWLFSIECAIITNSLLIPPKETVKIHFPDYFYEDNCSDKGVFSNITRKIQWIENSKYPAILFTRYVSPNELKTWITENASLIRKLQKNLPKKKDIRRKETTIFWGRIAWRLEQDGIESWKKKTDTIHKLMDEIEDNFKNRTNHLVAPSPSELQKSYNRFLESMKAITPK